MQLKKVDESLPADTHTPSASRHLAKKTVYWTSWADRWKPVSSSCSSSQSYISMNLLKSPRDDQRIPQRHYSLLSSQTTHRDLRSATLYLLTYLLERSAHMCLYICIPSYITYLPLFLYIHAYVVLRVNSRLGKVCRTFCFCARPVMKRTTRDFDGSLCRLAIASSVVFLDFLSRHAHIKSQIRDLLDHLPLGRDTMTIISRSLQEEEFDLNHLCRLHSNERKRRREKVSLLTLVLLLLGLLVSSSRRGIRREFPPLLFLLEQFSMQLERSSFLFLSKKGKKTRYLSLSEVQERKQ